MCTSLAIRYVLYEKGDYLMAKGCGKTEEVEAMRTRRDDEETREVSGV
jgi:hypothetical protein